jgi:hypothetical protein
MKKQTLVINNFDDEYIKIDLFDSDDNFISKLDKNQFLDVRTQAYLNDIKGLYVLYPNGEKGVIEHKTAGVSYFPEGLWSTTTRLTRNIMSLQVNDIKNQNRRVD